MLPPVAENGDTSTAGLAIISPVDPDRPAALTLFYDRYDDVPAVSKTVTPLQARVFSRETERNLAALEQRIVQLTELCEQLHTERNSLSLERSELSAERETLRAENQHTRSRIDAMVARLKGLEERS